MKVVKDVRGFSGVQLLMVSNIRAKLETMNVIYTSQSPDKDVKNAELSNA